METLVKPDLSAIKIRNVLMPGDLGYIAHVHADLYSKEYGYGLNFEAYVLDGLNDFAHEYDSLKDKVWICEHEDKIIGFLVAQHRDLAIQLRYFLFQPAYRGAGLGTKLMKEFISFMKVNKCTQAYLWTTEEQQAAIGLYMKFGFRLTEQKLSNAFDKKLVERRYELDLSKDQL
ncbi:GNAT family N-acetyltransferase [Dyadobacter frigoris]|uniref:GNAT family N-acetyltransferase n=1 Tax=Dyadobacter frigoris TaxID=2576211 RepID=A0A4U6CKJ8_9BACT|nr:GNAT family N-acetyltransferase [Dyadobacter frigoris]TKT84732.1 GNAT family N-acetyltransferase [Dyadobacter frigoris]GLU57415.1 hypothetical protein Dfri01_68760 [Dyadobacter frigoris]